MVPLRSIDQSVQVNMQMQLLSSPLQCKDGFVDVDNILLVIDYSVRLIEVIWLYLSI